MNWLRLISLTVVQLVKQIWFLPRSITEGNQSRRRRAVRVVLEAERLDRIRNPTKYLGK